MATDPRTLDDVLDDAVAHRVVGTTVVVARHGEVVYRRAAGQADRESGREAKVEDVHRLASITKPIVTVTALRLAERGLVDLRSPVTEHLPDFRPALPDGTRPTITLHHLLTHTAGLSYRFFAPFGTGYDAAGVSDGLGEPGRSLADNLERVLSVPLKFAPGSSWEYSVGMDVVGGVVEAVTGRSLPDVVREEVTGPLGLRATGFTVPDGVTLVAPYYDNPDGAPLRMADDEQLVPAAPDRATHFSPNRVLDPASFPSGGAGMVGTADELLTFFEALRTGRLLAPETFAAATRLQVGPEAATEGPGWGFGLGWAVLADPAASGTSQSAGTLQWGGAYGHKWFVDLENELTVVGLTNTTAEGMFGAFPADVREAAYRL